MSAPAAVPLIAYGDPPPEALFVFEYDDGTPIDGAAFLDMLEGLTIEEQDHLIWLRCRWDLELFCVLFFPTRFEGPFNALHRAVITVEDRVPAWYLRDRPAYRAWESSRGSAKTTLMSYACKLRDAVYGVELFTGLASTDYDLSETLVQDIYDTLRDPTGYEDLHRVYGPFEVIGSKTDFYVRVPGMDPRGSKYKAYSRGGACRGHKHKGVRFTSWMLDDFEHPKRVQNPDLRDEDERYIDRDIMRSGMKGTRVSMAGTAQDPDCVITRKRQHEAWDGHHFKAIISWPEERSGLWEECRRVWTDLTLGGVKERTAAALAFYHEHREAMDRGAEVLWPDHQPLFDLMIMYWSDEASFFAEMQNEPGRSAERTFDVSRFRWFKFNGETILRDDGREVALGSCEIGVHLDPKREGTKGTGRDMAAVAVVARDPHGVRYVLDVEYTKGPPSEQRAMFWRFFARFGPSAHYTYETNEGLNLDNDEHFQREQKQRWGQWDGRGFRPVGHPSRRKKEDRIARVQPDTLNGFLQFNEALDSRCRTEYRHFPNGRTDDGPDATERADAAASTGRRVARNVRV